MDGCKSGVGKAVHTDTQWFGWTWTPMSEATNSGVVGVPLILVWFVPTIEQLRK